MRSSRFGLLSYEIYSRVDKMLNRATFLILSLRLSLLHLQLSLKSKGFANQSPVMLYRGPHHCLANTSPSSTTLASTDSKRPKTARVRITLQFTAFPLLIFTDPSFFGNFKLTTLDVSETFFDIRLDQWKLQIVETPGKLKVFYAQGLLLQLGTGEILNFIVVTR